MTNREFVLSLYLLANIRMIIKKDNGLKLYKVMARPNHIYFTSWISGWPANEVEVWDIAYQAIQRKFLNRLSK